MWRDVLDRIESQPETATAGDLAGLLRQKEAGFLDCLFRSAYRVKERNVGRVVYLRGLIEVSNICRCNCHYCGLRSSNPAVNRYSMTTEEITDCAQWAWSKGFGSVVLQAGERREPDFVDFIGNTVAEIKNVSGGDLGVTLSLGEQSMATYLRWFNSGAHRYLIRIETSNEAHFKAIHPADIDFQARQNCLKMLRAIGYQVGTGVMVGLPGQTAEDLADDILFFKSKDVDMLGLGPYIPHDDTPLAARAGDYKPQERFNMALKMVALCRLVMPNINIASTTALQALNARGHEMGLLAGANVLMPNITPGKYRRHYVLYPGKPHTTDLPDECTECLVDRIQAIGETVGFYAWGDSPHAVARKNEPAGKQGERPRPILRS